MAGHYAAMKHSGAAIVRLPPTEADGMERSINQIGDRAWASDHGRESRGDDGDGAMVWKRHFAWVWSASCKRGVVDGPESLPEARGMEWPLEGLEFARSWESQSDWAGSEGGRSAGYIGPLGLSLIGMGLELGALVTTASKGQDEKARARFRDPKRKRSAARRGVARAWHGKAGVGQDAAEGALSSMPPSRTGARRRRRLAAVARDRRLAKRARSACLGALYPTVPGLLSNRKPARRVSGAGLLQPVDIGHRGGPADGFSTRHQAR
ncbi:hypothetical protein G7Z17_g9844 [Cylindrodendrum hubeiense]|uniref:Uncharacterized protein n=1 Tax=Cylindrodendrum hubeiense TaxID=595255 RepID=A0A9P5H8C2_9HYPO|nr:hypothetical protein G7Z17_g9844 [Cylindrodendrum hubeiense]